MTLQQPTVSPGRSTVERAVNEYDELFVNRAVGDPPNLNTRRRCRRRIGALLDDVHKIKNLGERRSVNGARVGVDMDVVDHAAELNSQSEMSQSGSNMYMTTDERPTLTPPRLLSVWFSAMWYCETIPPNVDAEYKVLLGP